MIVAQFSFSSTLIRFLLINLSVILWSGVTLAQPSSVQMAEEQALARIKAQLERQQSGEALQLIERFLDQSQPPAFIDQFTFLYAVALEAQGERQQAIVILEQFLEEYPVSLLSHDARLMLGTLYIESQRPNRAVPILSRALDLASDRTARAAALQRLCLAYESSGDYLRAIRTVLTYVEQAGKNERRDLLDYIQRLILEKMNERSLGNVLDAFSTTYPGDLALIRLIELHAAQGDDVSAQRDIRAFLQRFPDHPYAQTAVALLQTFIAKIKAHRHVIAVVFPFSGKLKPFGTQAFNGIRLALEEEVFLGVNAVGLVVKDSGLPPARFRRELSQLLDDFAPVALIGPLLAQEVRLLGDAPDRAAVPFLTPTATLQNVRQSGRYWFSTAMTPPLQVKRVVEYAMQHFGYTRFCVLAPQTPHGTYLNHIFQQTVVENGGEVVAEEFYQSGTTDASAQIARIKNKDLSLYGEMLPLGIEEPDAPEKRPVREGQPEGEEAPLIYTPGFDAVFLPGRPADVAFLAAQLAFFDVNVPLLGTNGWNHPNLLTWGRSFLDGGLFGDALFLQTTEQNARNFITRYRERFQSDPSIFAVQAYDAMRMILDTVRRGATSGAEVREQLFVRRDLPTLGGLGGFDAGGIFTRKVYMIQIRNGRFIQLN